MKKSENNINKILVKIVLALFTINIGVMIFFTASIHSKLNATLKLMEPQTGVLTLINPVNCPQCQSLEKITDYIETQNVEFSETKIFLHESSEGKEIIQKYGIKQLPAFVFEGDKKIKSDLVKALKAEDKLFDEKTLLIEMTLPPFYDIEENTIKGLVEVTFLTDGSCGECYDVIQTQRPTLEKFGVIFRNQNTVDVSTPKGQELIEQYSITKVPTMILSAEVSSYEALSDAWENVGTVEEDGNYVFRELDELKMQYRNLTTNDIIIIE